MIKRAVWTSLSRPISKLPWRKNVVCVRGKAKSDWKKFGDPESGPRRHPGEVCMNVVDSQRLAGAIRHTQPDKAEESRCAGPTHREQH